MVPLVQSLLMGTIEFDSDCGCTDIYSIYNCVLVANTAFYGIEKYYIYFSDYIQMDFISYTKYNPRSN